LVDRLVSNPCDGAIKLYITRAGRFFLKFCESKGCPAGETWANTAVVLPKRIGRQTFQVVFTGLSVTGAQEDGNAVIPLGEAFKAGRLALLFSGEYAD